MNKKLLELMIYLYTLSNKKLTLNKLFYICFYIDFTFYRDYKKSITGTTYLNTVYGPVVKNADKYIKFIKTHDIKIVPIYTGEKKNRIHQIFNLCKTLTEQNLSYRYSNEFASVGTPFSHPIDMDKSYYMDIALDNNANVSFDKVIFA